MDREVRGVEKSQTQLTAHMRARAHAHTHTHTHTRVLVAACGDLVPGQGLNPGSLPGSAES